MKKTLKEIFLKENNEDDLLSMWMKKFGEQYKAFHKNIVKIELRENAIFIQHNDYNFYGANFWIMLKNNDYFTLTNLIRNKDMLPTYDVYDKFVKEVFSDEIKLVDESDVTFYNISGDDLEKVIDVAETLDEFMALITELGTHTDAAQLPFVAFVAQNIQQQHHLFPDEDGEGDDI